MQHVHEYAANQKWFTANGFNVTEGDDAYYANWTVQVIREASISAEHDLSILVDISSLTRIRMAHLIVALTEWDRPITATFAYSLASYVSPPASAPANSHVGPVLPHFAGWWDEPDRDLAAIVGLGYEQDKALGAVEHLQAGEIWTLSPVSDVQEYSPALVKANRTLLDAVPARNQLVYQVNDPVHCFTLLESLVYGVSRTKNALLLPFGPKIFTLCGLLIGVLNPSVPVWRVSAEVLRRRSIVTPVALCTECKFLYVDG